MVFSFFKKSAQKMPERQAAKPRAQATGPVYQKAALAPPPEPVAELPPESPEPLPELLPDLEFASSGSLKPPPAAARDDFDDGGFSTASALDIKVDHDGDPVQGDIEHAVVLFANGQDAAARTLLETLIRAYPGDEGRRFWLLLLDLLQCIGDRAAFDKLALEFVQTWETSPPPWRETKPAAAGNGARQHRLALRGVLTNGEAAPLDDLAGWLAQGQAVAIECGRLAGCDDVVAGRLAALLSEARHKGVAVTLHEVDGFLARLGERLQPGEAVRETAWALLLELLLRHGTQEQFEERAVDYAVTFERSPPSWESPPALAAEEPSAFGAAAQDGACYLEGDLKNCRFDELAALEDSEHPVIDFSGVRRMDFFSAGQLVNRVAALKARGHEVLIRGPGHLLAELMVVVGLNKQARILVAKS